MFDFNDLKDLAKISERIIEESGMPRHLEGIDEDKVISCANRVEESIESSMLVPLYRVQDRHDFHPVQGKESDGEIMFRFESVIDAQNLYDFMTNMGLVEPGEIKLHISEHQVSVHFASGVLFSKPEVIQTALMAYEDNVVGSEEDAFESMVEIVDNILTERTKVSGAPKKRAKGNPFHDKGGRLSGPDDISGEDGGSFSMGKTKLKFAGKKKSKKGDMVVNFASTKRPCGRKARTKGKNIRCWDGSQMEAVASVLEKKNKMQYVEDAELEDMVRVLDAFERGASVDMRKDWVPAKATKEDVDLDEAKKPNKMILKKIMKRLGIDDYTISGSGDSIELEFGDRDTADKLEKKVQKHLQIEFGAPWGGYKTGYGAWVLKPSYKSGGDFNDKGSRWHY